jgi:hypothetical protein
MTSPEPLASPALPPEPIAWPDGFTAAACLTFDMDAEAAILTADINWGSVMMTVVLGALGRLIALRNVRRGAGTARPVQHAAPVAEDR